MGLGKEASLSLKNSNAAPAVAREKIAEVSSFYKTLFSTGGIIGGVLLPVKGYFVNK
jgi:hypothetical protein